MREKKLLAVLGLSLLLWSACSTLEQKGKEVLDRVDQISEKDKELMTKTGEALRSSFQDLTDEEEYYIGRSVSALILSRYKVWNNEAAIRYLNLLAQTIALYSNRPEIFAGYHVLILDSDEVNALSAPGGFIFITRGLLRLCQDEDTLAGILAHEIGHISARHGLQAIKKSRLLEAFRLLASEAAERLAPDKLAQMTDIFEGTLDDIIVQLIERGYDRKAEFEADMLALRTLKRIGYSARGLIHFVKELEEKKQETTRLEGWLSTHPDPGDRLKRLQAEVSSWEKEFDILKIRTDRFRRAASAWK